MSMPSYWYDPMVNTLGMPGNDGGVNARLAQSATNSVAANNALANQTFQQGQDDFWKWSNEATRLNAAYVAANLAVGKAMPVGTYNGNALSPFATGTAPIQHLGGTNGLQPFNPGSYLVKNPDVFAAGADPWQHYNQFGQNEGRQGAWGNTTFDAPSYLANNPDVWAAGADPMQHWLTSGWTEGRQGAWGEHDFTGQNYLANNPDVFAAGMDPTAHWLQFGRNEGRQGAWGDHDFNEQNYLANNLDVFKAGVDPVQHWLQYGRNEGRQGGWGENLFDAQGYSQHNPDVAAAGMDPTAHWLQFGSQEGRQGGWGGEHFNPQEYLLNNRDVAAAGADPLQHWMNFGWKEGRQQAFGGTEDADWSGYFGQAGTGSRDAIAAAYLTANPDVFDWAKASGQDPTKSAFEHFQDYGENEGRRMFDAAEYLRENPDVAAAGANPFEHYSQYGQAEGRFMPSGEFNPESYLAYNPDVFAAGADPWQHYSQYGINEGRRGAWEGNDAYMMAADYSSPYGNPTGVGDSGYGDGYGGYGNSWESPFPTPPGANIADPKSFWVSNDQPNIWEASRAPYTKDLANDPARMYDMAVRLYLELNNDPVGRQGIAEAMFNRYAARTKYPSGEPIDPLNPNYFPHDLVRDPRAAKYLADYAKTTAWLKTQPELLGRIYGEIGRAAGGSNITNAATDWASLDVADRAAKLSTETWKSPNEGERFFRKDIANSYAGLEAARQIQEWYRNMMSSQPQWPQ